MRDDLGEQRYRAENERYRDAARQLSPAREAEVNLATLAALRERYPDEVPAARGAPTGARAGARARRGRGRRSRPSASREATDAIAARGRRHRRLAARRRNDFALVEAGIERAYRRGRRGLAAVRDDPSAESVHDWRKRVKDLWYQLRLLQDAWPAVLKASAAEAHELADLLGDHHDLSVLVAKAGDRRPSDPDTAALVTLAERRQAELLDAALQLGDRLYAEKPDQFTRRIERYWRAWRPPDGG